MAKENMSFTSTLNLNNITDKNLNQHFNLNGIKTTVKSYTVTNNSDVTVKFTGELKLSSVNELTKIVYSTGKYDFQDAYVIMKVLADDTTSEKIEASFKKFSNLLENHSGSSEEVEKNDVAIKFTTTQVEDLENIFAAVPTGLAISCVTKVCNYTKAELQAKKGKWSKFSLKEGGHCLIYYPNGSDTSVAAGTPTVTRFLSHFAPDWSRQCIENKNVSCNPTGLAIGWHALFNKEVLDGAIKRAGLNEIGDFFWVVYACSLVKCKPAASWRLDQSPTGAKLYLMYNIINDTHNKVKGKKSDFTRKAVSALTNVGAAGSIDNTVFDLFAEVMPIINKKSGASAATNEIFLGLLSGVLSKATTYVTANTAIKVTADSDENSLKEAVNLFRKNKF